MVSPIIDLALIVNIVATVTSIHEHGYTAVKGDLQLVAFFWILFAAIDGVRDLTLTTNGEVSPVTGSYVPLIPQRFGYRQIMYYVVIKAVVQALRGPRVGWSSIARTGKVKVGSGSRRQGMGLLRFMRARYADWRYRER